MEPQQTASTFQRLKGQETEPQTAWDDITNEFEARPSCQVIGFTGAKGGVGTTTVALNVAMALVQASKKVIYVELSPHVAAVSWLLHMPQTMALRDFSVRLDEINRDYVTKLLMQHSTGLEVLCLSPWTQEVGSPVSTELFAALLQELKGLADYVVLDFPLEPSYSSMLFLSHCQILDLVMETDSLCLALAKNQIEFIKSQCTTPILLTPVNRSGIPPADGIQGIQNQVGHEAPAMIPPAHELCHTACVKRLPIVCINPNSVPALQFVKLGERLLNSFQEDGSEVTRNRRGQDRRKSDRRDRGGW
jgi:pilus assembly protein CpaE